MNRVLNLAAFNIRVLLGDPTWFILSWALFALQLAIYGSLISRLVGSNLPNYFFFYSIGLMIIVVFESAEDVGRHFVEHAHEGELPYFLSLPVSRSGFLVAQAIYGVVNTLVKVAPPLLAVLFIWGNLSLRRSLRPRSAVSSGIGYHRNDGISVFHRFQSSGHLHGGLGGTLCSSDQIQHRLLPSCPNAQLLLRSEEHTSELQSQSKLLSPPLLVKK